MKNGSLEHFVHVLHLRCVRAGDEGGSAGDELGHWVDRAINGTAWVGFGFAPNRSRRRGLVLGEAVDEVVHDDIGKIDVLTSGVVEVVSSDGKSVAVATEHEDVKVGTGEGNAGSKGKGTAVNEVDAVGVHKVWESR